MMFDGSGREEVCDFIVKRLHQWGVRRIYGYTGDGINGVMGALNRHSELIEFIQVPHEEIAAFMACAHAKFTGEVGVCMASSGPGAIHLLNGLYDAKMDQQPVVALVGQQVRSAMGSYYQQEVDLENLFKDVAGAYVHTATSASQVRHLIDQAFRVAKAQRTVTCVILPLDVQHLAAVPYPKAKHGHTLSGVSHPVSRLIPAEQELRRAAGILNRGERVAMLVGAGAKKAAAEVLEMAEILGAGVAKALLGLDVVPDDCPFVTGSIGLLGTRPTDQMIRNCDTLLMIGTNFPYSEFLPKEGQARGVQIDINPATLSLRYPMDVNLAGDSAETLRALIPYLKYKTDRTWQDRIRENKIAWQATLEQRAQVDAADSTMRVNPQCVFRQLSTRLPSNSILCTDTGTSTVWFAQYLEFKKGMMASASGSLASMGNGIPYALAAKFAYPDRPVFAFVGDGVMEMNGNNGLISLAKYWERWSDPRFVVLVLNNRDLNFVTWEMRVQEGNPKFEAAQNLPDFPYASYAQSLGLEGVTIRQESDIAPMLDIAMRARKPVIIEACTDPSIPPLPPHISFSEASSLMKALLKGDPDRIDVIRDSALEILASFTSKKGRHNAPTNGHTNGHAKNKDKNKTDKS